jgi:hypothetical protein
MEQICQDLAGGQTPLPASLSFVHLQAPVWEMLDDDVITNCHCQLGMAKSSATKNAVFILAL